MFLSMKGKHTLVLTLNCFWNIIFLQTKYVKSYTRKAVNNCCLLYKTEAYPTSKSCFLTSGSLSNSFSFLLMKKQDY